MFLTKLSNGLSGFSIAELYPSIKLLDSMMHFTIPLMPPHSQHGLRRKLMEMVVESDRMLDPIIEEHISKKTEATTEDLVDVLLKFQKDELDDDTSRPFSLTRNNIKAIILEMFGAGSYREIEEASLSELKFLKLVIKEILRLHPPAPLLILRESIKHCQIQGYNIPPTTRVVVNAWAIATDPKCWIEPDMFKPERFEGSSIEYKGTNFELNPFGARRRMCPGMTLGLANIELLLAILLYHFDWKLPNEINPEDLDMNELFGITVRRKSELLVIPIPYTPSSLV
ncbi:hypothetical protein Cgig2_026287 [Carnegiea gigantea]|uniref:Cytochrome P450 n=1 Tax=Carnegiea gigantea TaxID=171969 RepID=A0A9Q1JQK5_9CARY|nr:hypothetical protein Cgig2_026287 [Carnegiea gigantea]